MKIAHFGDRNEQPREIAASPDEYARHHRGRAHYIDGNMKYTFAGIDTSVMVAAKHGLTRPARTIRQCTSSI